MKKQSIGFNYALVIVFFFMLLFISYKSVALADYAKDCSESQNKVIPALKNAISIQVIEHSSAFDGNIGDKTYKEKVFSILKLSPNQILSLRNLLSTPTDENCNRIDECVFSSHHRIEALQPDGHVFKIEICFECGDMMIGDKQVQQIPNAWLSKFDSFISSIGMHPHGPWKNKK